jgi:hypothetical protein
LDWIMATAQLTITAAQVLEVRALLEKAGYLPLTNKAMRILGEVETSGPRLPGYDAAFVASIRAQLAEAGYVSYSRAKDLLDLADRIILANG